MKEEAAAFIPPLFFKSNASESSSEWAARRQQRSLGPSHAVPRRIVEKTTFSLALSFSFAHRSTFKCLI